jgi:hypothetical protein
MLPHVDGAKLCSQQLRFSVVENSQYGVTCGCVATRISPDKR